MKIKIMPIKDPENIRSYAVIYLFILTIFGSIASYSYHLINGEKFRISVLICQILVSAFAGTLVVLGASFFNWPFELAGGVAGLSGWSGATLIKALEERLMKKAKGKD